MDLNQIRKILVDCENSIIFGILERSGWKYDPEIYRNNNSIFFKLLRDTELIHAKYGRYSCPEEHPFSLDIDKTNNYKYELSDFLSSDTTSININLNNKILEGYHTILEKISEIGTDENMGSAVTADINLLQAISRRCHLGKIVAEIKYRENPTSYHELVNDNDIFNLLTNQEVEDSIINRIREKSKNYSIVYPKINHGDITDIFKTIVIPLTKLIEVEYLKNKIR